jgi:hypothetical protein
MILNAINEHKSILGEERCGFRKKCWWFDCIYVAVKLIRNRRNIMYQHVCYLPTARKHFIELYEENCGNIRWTKHPWSISKSMKCLYKSINEVQTAVQVIAKRRGDKKSRYKQGSILSLTLLSKWGVTESGDKYLHVTIQKKKTTLNVHAVTYLTQHCFMSPDGSYSAYKHTWFIFRPLNKDNFVIHAPHFDLLVT